MDEVSFENIQEIENLTEKLVKGSEKRTNELIKKKENCIYKICLKSVTISEYKSCKNCNSSFHEKHILEWIKTKNQCAVCQFPLKMRDYLE